MKKKKLSQKEFLKSYYEILLETGKEPASIYKFCKDLGVEETEFYEHFSSFDVLERSFFTSFAAETIGVLDKSKEYETYDAKSKLLSFYYTFFELLTKNRTLVLLLLKEDHNKLNVLSKLKGLRSSFQDYLNTLDLETPDLKVDKLEKFQEKSIAEIAWGQMLYILKFWVEDSSPSFEKTDQLIEKTVQASFDMINNPALTSIMDLGKFLWKEKQAMFN